MNDTLAMNREICRLPTATKYERHPDYEIQEEKDEIGNVSNLGRGTQNLIGFRWINCAWSPTSCLIIANSTSSWKSSLFSEYLTKHLSGWIDPILQLEVWNWLFLTSLWKGMELVSMAQSSSWIGKNILGVRNPRKWEGNTVSIFRQHFLLLNRLEQFECKVGWLVSSFWSSSHYYVQKWTDYQVKHPHIKMYDSLGQRKGQFSASLVKTELAR